MTITQARLKELLHYDLDTGVFTWLRPLSNRVRSGDKAGQPGADGYWRINVAGQSYLAHRLAWLYVTGRWPVQQIDHKNNIRNDNRFSNLRDVSPSMNLENQQKPRSNNSTGFLGVSHGKKGRFRAIIKADGRYVALGTYDTPEEAHAVYLAAKRASHPGSML